jgi:hypothetical protein
MWALDRLRVEAHGVEAYERAVVARYLVAPEAAHGLQVFAAPPTAMLEGNAEGLELLALPAHADTELDPPGGKNVQIGH